MATSEISPGGLPASIRRALRRLDGQLRMARALAGLGTLAWFGALGAALGMGADFLWELPGWCRWAIWCAWVAWLSAIGLTRLAWPLVRRRGWAELAALAERGDPGLEERLTGAVDLLGQEPGHPAHGAPALIRALAEQAETEVSGRRLTRAVPFTKARRRAIVGCAALVAVALPVWVWPDPFADLARRFLAPWASVERVGRYAISVRPGDAWVARGDPLKIEAAIRPRLPQFDEPPVEAWLEWTDARGRSGTRRMGKLKSEASTRPGSAAFAVSLPAVNDSLDYRVVTRMARSSPYGVRAIEPPKIAHLSALVAPPPYTGLEKVEVPDPTWIEAWQDSAVTLTVSADREIRGIELAWPGEVSKKQAPETLSTGIGHSPRKSPEPAPILKTAMARADDSGKVWSVTVPAWATGPFTMELKDDLGIRSRPEAPRRVEVRQDAAPRITLIRPEPPRVPGAEHGSEPAVSTENLVAREELIRFGLAAEDDLGVASAELHYTIRRSEASGAEPGAEEKAFRVLQLNGLNWPSARGVVELDLAALGLEHGDRVSYRIRVTDTLPPPRGPNETWSDERDLQVVDRPDLLAERDAAERKAMQARLDELKKAAAAGRQRTEQLRYAADAARRGNGSWNQTRAGELERAEAEARDLTDRLQELARDLAAQPDLASLAEPARRTAELEAEAAREALDRARRADDDLKRLAELKQADAAAASVQNRIEELQRQFDTVSKAGEDRRKLADLATREARLADRATELATSPAPGLADRARLDQIEAEQEAVRREVDELLRKSPALKGQALLDQSRKAEALVDRVRALADRQIEIARQTADPTRLAPALRALIVEQRQLEDDTRRLALRVDPVLDESGLAHANPEAVARVAEPLRRADLDTTRQRMDESESNLARLARDLEDLNRDPKALARRLARRQAEQRDQVLLALGPEKNKSDLSEEEARTLADKLGPLAARQAGIAELATALVEHTPDAQRDLARQAASRAADVEAGLRDPSHPSQIDGKVSEARNLFNRLANDLPDTSRRRAEAQRLVAEARQRTEQVAREMDNVLRDTSPRPGRPFHGPEAERERARRLGDLSRREAEAAAQLAALPVEDRLVDHRDRAAHRALALAEALARSRPDALPGSLADARAGIERLAVALEGRIPSDKSAEALAAGLRSLASHPSAEGIDREMEARRFSAALRALEANDSRHFLAEAVDASTRAADAIANEQADPQARNAALTEAAQAAERLARRMTDQLNIAELAEGLATIERGLDRRAESGADPADLARTQRHLADDLARLDLSDDAGKQAMIAVKRASELAERAALLPPSSDTLPPTPETVALARAEAAQALDRLAHQKVPPRAEVPVLPHLRAQAAELARHQRELAEQMTRIQEEVAALPDGNAALASLADRLAPVIEQQEELVHATRSIPIPEPPGSSKREAENQRAIALSSQGRVLSAIARRDPAEAANLAREAASGLERLAELLPELTAEQALPQSRPIPPDPELDVDPKLIANAHQLVARQRKLREQVQAIMSQAIADQEALQSDSARLGRQIADLRESLGQLSPTARNQADQVASLVGRQAPQAMAEALHQLSEPRIDQARASQRRSTDLLEQAAQQAEQMTQSIRSDLAAVDPNAAAQASKPPRTGQSQDKNNANATDSRGLADAREQLDEARRLLAQAREPEGPPTSEAAGAMRRAAEALRLASAPPPEDTSALMAELGGEMPNAQASEEGGESDPNAQAKANPHPSTTDPKDAGTGKAAPDLAQLQAMLRAQTGRSWGELPGHLRSEILQMAQGRYRDDYARLIRLYFREIASAGSSPVPPPPQPQP